MFNVQIFRTKFWDCHLQVVIPGQKTTGTCEFTAARAGCARSSGKLVRKGGTRPGRKARSRSLHPKWTGSGKPLLIEIGDPAEMAQEVHIILLSDERVFGDLSEYLQRVNSAARIYQANSIRELEGAMQYAARPVRLLSFLTDVIIPGDMIRDAGMAGYNIHPGPPEYPGSSPTGFAIWEQARSFGATAHELSARVDEGTIVATRSFPMPPEPDELALGDLAFSASVDLFSIVGRHCAQSLNDLPPSGAVWSGKKRRRADISRLRASWPLLAGQDRERLRRAFSGSIPAECRMTP